MYNDLRDFSTHNRRIYGSQDHAQQSSPAMLVFVTALTWALLLAVIVRGLST